ncbi:MAG TPA: TerB N-terminal domain-containing protein [Zoogloea sp.]|nr:TerB N-terminal domain-containing protein [Zoogloea sp.]
MTKKKTGDNALIIGVAIFIALIASIPKELIGLVIVIAVLAFAFWLVSKLVKLKKSSSQEKINRPVKEDVIRRTSVTIQSKERTTPELMGTFKTRYGVDEDFATFTLGDEREEYSFRIAKSSVDIGAKWKWYSMRESVSIAGFNVTGGLLYVGCGLQIGCGEIEPALINPDLKVASSPVDLSAHLVNYWPNYSSISPDARRAYLQWLSGGRADSNVDIGYVFLFFYGLERRLLADAKTDADAWDEAPVIIAELRRLLSIHGGNNSFRRYATHFITFLEAKAVPDKTYLQKPPEAVEQGYELPLPLKIALGQLAVDQVPVSTDWALAWALNDPNIKRRTPVTRCATEFAHLFRQSYSRLYGNGLLLKQNRTKLQVSYQPASSGFNGRAFSLNLSGLPDVSAVKGPVQKLQALVDEATVQLEPYSRFIGRNPDKKQALEGILQLPVELWPSSVKAEVEEIKARIGDSLLILTFGELSGRLKSAGPLSRDKVLGLARALESLHVGMEPDVLAGSRLPKAEDKIALFATHPEDGETRVDSAYRVAAVTLDLGCAVAFSDGGASDQVLLQLSRHIESWTHLSVARRKRLKAYLRLSIDKPAKVGALKKKLEPLPTDARRRIARFLAHLAQADGVVSPQEVKLLERTYKTLGLDIKLVYSDLSASEALQVPVTTETTRPQPQTFTLDSARIALLQKETAEVAALLANVFAEETASEITASFPHAAEPDTVVETSGVLGLDADHSAFLRLLVTRSSWLRGELENAAADMELMLDGALEHINEAVLDAFDEPLTEGEDPIEINKAVLETLPA